MPDKDQIAQRLTDAGWGIDDGFSGYLIIGDSADTLSIIAHLQSYDGEKPLFELLDHMKDVSYWAQEIPSPQQAQKLLDEHGKSPEEWDE
jgi:hypothetical protein